MTLEAAKEWGCPPWEITGEQLTPWRRLVWKERRKLYVAELMAKKERDHIEIESRVNRGRS